MKRNLIGATCLLLVALAGQAASAAMIEGQFVPDELVGKVGTQYRLVFVTSGLTTASSTNPAVYDSFLAQQVQNTMLGTYSYGWKAVVSTAELEVNGDTSVRIAKNIVSDALYGVDPAEEYAGVYNTANTAGARLAASGDAMLNHGLGVSLLNPAGYDQNGDFVSDGLAWTGSYSTGEPWFTVPPARVGENSNITAVGNTGATTQNWLSSGTVTRNDGPNPYTAHIYGMSDVLIVPVPEPATIMLWSVCTGIVGLAAWRKRRSSK